MNRETFILLPAWVFLFILPFTHTVALRLSSLFIASLVTVFIWLRSPRAGMSGVPAWPLIAFWAALPLALLPFSVDVPYSLNEVKTEVGYGLLALTLFFMGVRSDRALQNTLRVTVAAFFALTIWATASWIRRGTWQEDAFFGGSAGFSVYLATVTPMFVVVWYARPFGQATRAVVYLSVFFALLTGFLTEQRTFWFAAGVQVVGAAVLFSRASRNFRISGTAALGVIAFAAIATGAFALAIVIRYGAHTSVDEVIAADLRLRYWPVVIDWIAAAPVTGHGFGRGIMSKAYPAEVRPMGIFWHAHNVVLNYGFQLGVGGIIAILGVFGGLLRYWLKVKSDADPLVRAAGIAGVLMVLGVLARNMTNDMFQRDLALLFWSLTGLLGAVATYRTPRPA